MKSGSFEIILLVLSIFAGIAAVNSPDDYRSPNQPNQAYPSPYPTPYPSQTIIVTNTNDSGFGSLRQAIADANTNGWDKINFASYLAGETIRLQSTLTINKNITIDASALSEKIILNGDSDNDSDGDILIINILANQVVTIKNVEFTKGYTPHSSNAGAIANLGDLSIYDSEFNSNQGGQGGAIRNSGTLFISHSSFTSNTAIEGGAILNNINSNAEITNSTFSSNSAYEINNLGGAGGAIANVGTFYVSDSEFTNNSATGGGALVNAFSGEVMISYSTFIGNSATKNGGAINNLEGTAHITKSTFLNNSAALGGAIIAGEYMQNYVTITIISESVISNNQATNAGGGIEFESGTSMLIDTTTISGNTALTGGGTVNVSGNLLTITNSTISNNIATQSPQPGGILSLFSSPVTIKNSTVTGNNHTAVGIQGVAIISNTTIAGNSGYGLEVHNYSLSITNSILANNGNFDCRTQNGAIVTTNQNNLIETNSGCGTPASTSDPLLGALADNGGLTQTMALLSGSPAIEAGNNATCETTDQRGMSRPQGSNCDMGSYEYKTPVTLSAPKIPRTMFRFLTNNPTPTLSWLQVHGAFEYEITIASDKAFNNIALTETSSTTSFTPSASLTDGIYYWKVRALNEISQPGKFSIIQTLTIDTTAPAIPTLTSPTDGAILKRSPTLRWTKVTSGVLYEIQIDDNNSFSSPTTYSIRSASHRLAALPDGIYYWRIRVKDAAGNWSAWSVIRTFTMQ